MIEKNDSSEVSLASVRRTAMNHFETRKYKSAQCKERLSGDGGGIRRSRRVAGNISRELNVDLSYECSLEKDTHSKPVCLDLNSRKLRRYIIEDVMYMKPGEDFLLLVCDDSRDIYDWNKIIDEQSNGLIKILFGTKSYHQINASVVKNVSRDAFINGEYDNDRMDYHVLGIGGAAISISLYQFDDSKSIELKFSQILTDVDIQVCGVSPMKRNLLRNLQRRAATSRGAILKCMLDEL